MVVSRGFQKAWSYPCCLHGPNICIVLYKYFIFDVLHINSLYMIRLRNQFIPSEGSAKCWESIIEHTPGKCNFHRTWWDLSRTKIFAPQCRVSLTKKGKWSEREQWEMGEEGVRGFWVRMSQRHWRPPAVRKAGTVCFSQDSKHWTSCPVGYRSGSILRINRINPVWNWLVQFLTCLP